MPLLFLLAACGADDDGLRTLETCETSFSDDVPAFFADHFKCVDATVEGDEVVLRTTDLPPHASPYYEEADPNWVAFDDRGGDWFQNPNLLVERDLEVRVPLEPVSRGLTIDDTLVDYDGGSAPEEEYRGMPPGIALDGTAFFHGVAAPGDDIRDERYSFDLQEGHPENTGIYHHHSPAPGSLAVLGAAGLVTSTTPGEAELELYGVMCDGTWILGCTELDGGDVSTADLDAQRGHTHDMVDVDGVTQFAGRYHTHLCEALDDHIYAPEIQASEGCG